MLPTQFNIRVYGLLVDDGRILVTDEFRLNTFMTKFPGGALEFGEGTIDCLKREFREELGMEIDVVSHFYTTDFFQQTELLPANMQLINIYYVVKADKPYPFSVSEKKFDFNEVIEGAQSFRWVMLKDLPGELTLPIDLKIAPKIRDFFEHRSHR
jgi:8-oxo-dGTP diphosphatase